MAYFILGDLQKAATMTERAIDLNPTIVGHYERLSAIYALLGRKKDAEAAYNKSMKAYSTGRFPSNVKTVMSSFFIKDRKVSDHYAEGLVKAGWPGTLSQYYKIYEENRLNGEEIHNLVSGKEITVDEFGRIYWVNYYENGRFKDIARVRDGDWWIEDDMLCSKVESNPAEEHLPRLKGLINCGEIYRNPDSLPGSGKQYLYVRDYGIAALTAKE